MSVELNSDQRIGHRITPYSYFVFNLTDKKWILN